ncbi:MAG: hypothetical protein GTO45_26460 [Candidatus Aminicenantes bacterium]|nr:hypothetical protein [Candidatus Aminicenantes bacterium]NIN21673.1 hypothetical protein [Candidatus Aminicenantes bacterium]NIN45482.1 hypothetical protein [Candidatus Aminicenantes bacterium]NIN88313.1 hypothetical protein [Candidatus Aminicenantes bacterium]NIO84706.1 hypothetical protein [Candidatus Aminicenantes bacterium]
MKREKKVTASETIMKKKREEMKKEFLALTPLQRIRRMNAVFNDIIALKAKTKGVPEYEIYRSYLKSRK